MFHNVVSQHMQGMLGFLIHLTTNCTKRNLPVIFFKSVKIWQNYDHESVAPFLANPVYWLRVDIVCFPTYPFFFTFSLLMPSVLWRCWLGGRKGIRPVKTEWWGAGIIIWLERGANLHSGCHCHSLSLASVKSRLVLPFWYRLTWVVPDKGPLNGCSSVVVPYGTLSQAADLENFATTLQVDCIVNKTRRLHQRSSLLATPLRQSTSLGCLLQVDQL